MKFSTLFLMLFISTNLMAKRGPQPHERTNTPKMGHSTTGRYMYLGNVPKFDGSELEITISKMNLTVRVTAYVNQERIDGYAQQLFLRWKRINDALLDVNFSLHPLVKLSKLSESKPENVKAWSKIAEQYSSHILESTGLNIYSEIRNAKKYVSNQAEDEYKDLISKAYFKFLFDTELSSDEIIDDNEKFEKLLSKENSARLFKKHLGHLFKEGLEKKDYRGTLTFVYPIAATVEGPFGQPKEMITDLKTAESLEARWWSNKWKDEFGGFPFLLIEWSGVAFHGPITNYSPLDVWFLKRDYVSHGCHRMDASDVLELRALMPIDLRKAAESIKVVVLDYFDVIDFNKDGKFEAVDVKYYHIPSPLTVMKKNIDETIAPYLVKNQEKAFLTNNKYASKYYEVLTDKLKGIPKYSVGKKTLTRTGHHESVDILRFDFRPNRIIQYAEEGIKLQGFDDLSGKYPPKYFQRY
jgi:L,D-transpeptidase catalytic domain